MTLRRVERIGLALTALLLGSAGFPVSAHADPAPLYQLVDTAAQRLLTAEPVAAFKWLNGGPITDPERAGQVLDNVASDATAHGIDAAYVRAQFSNQIDATEGIQYTRFGQWKFDPATAPTTAPDLSETRTAIDGFNKLMVDEVALQWDSLHGPSCQIDLTDATDAVAAAREFDGLYRQALWSATRSYCPTT